VEDLYSTSAQAIVPVPDPLLLPVSLCWRLEELECIFVVRLRELEYYFVGNWFNLV
jgi:hypothetical protein